MVGLDPSFEAAVGASGGRWGGAHGVRDSPRPGTRRFVSTSRRIVPTNRFSGVRWNDRESGYVVRSSVSRGARARSVGVETNLAVTTGDPRARRQRLNDAGVENLDVFDRGSEDERRGTDVDPPHHGLIRGWSRW